MTFAISRRRPCAVLRPLVFAAAMLLAALPHALARASEPAPSIAGIVIERGGSPLASATVVLDARRRAVTGADGSFAFDAVAPGRHVLRAERVGFEPNVRAVEVVAGQALNVEIPLEAFHYEETVVISASASPRTTAELYQPSSVLSGAELLAAARPSLGETLEGQPGVSSTYFGPGASRPIIRGLGGDRVRVMGNGLEVGDASGTSPDHAVSSDAMQAERIEVIRGPATLRWGSNAIGGVVNVLDNRLPTSVPETPVTGIAQLSAGSNASERAGSLVLDGGAREFAWHLDGFLRDADDADTPWGRLANSWTEASGAAAGLAWIGESGRFAISHGGLDTQYGSPADEEVSIDLSQRRWDAEGEIRWKERPFRSLVVRAGTAGYEHVELEGDEVGTRFLNDAFEARVEATHAWRGRHEGSFGLQNSDRDFEAIGDEAFVPPTSTRSLGVFAFQEIHLPNAWKVEAGARFDTRDVDVRDGSGRGRDLGGFSGSVGILRSGTNGWGFAASLTRVVKLPNAEELFSLGPHLATNAYEIGDPDLREETALGLELGVKKKAEWWSIELNAFSQSFDGFIRESPTGEIEDGLPVYRFLQEDATLRGGEFVAEIGLNRHERHHLRLDLALEHVRAEGEDDPLPRIPPFTGSLTLRYDGPRAWAVVRGTWVDAQDRVTPFESPTRGHSLLEAQAGFRIVAGLTAHDIIVRGTNLLDETALVHASFLKDVAPRPGRGLTLQYRIVF